MEDYGSELFVGRKKELKSLESCWITATTGKTAAKRVYAVLNAPGVGKTALLEHFGEKLMAEKRGLMVEINVFNTGDKIYNYLSLTMKAMRNSIIKNRILIEEYIINRIKEDKLKTEFGPNEQYPYINKNDAFEELDGILKGLNILIKKYDALDYSLDLTPEYLANLSNIFPSRMSDLARLIPLYLFLDEIQILQSLNYVNKNKKKETFLHLCSKELADLLPTTTLLVVSGTQYQLMKQIGYKLGSPLRNKVKHFVIHPLNRENLEEYHKYISQFFLEKYQSIKNPDILLQWYLRLIFGYSGGHARTLVNLTDEFLTDYEQIIKIPSSYEEFLDQYTNLSDVVRFFPDFTSEARKGIIELQKNEDFNKVHEWIMNLSMFGSNLRKRPEVKKNNANTEHITNVLVQIGVLMINGKENYYITSYFHLLAYLNAIKDDYSIFLNEILTNKYFKQMCGYHGGLGYAFEEILLATIMKVPSSFSPKIAEKIPFNLSRAYNVIKLPKSVNFNSLNLEDNTIYHTPQHTGIDFIITNLSRIVLIQVTTIQSVNSAKIRSLDNIYSALQENNREFSIIKWFLSLTPVSVGVFGNLSDETKQDLKITADQDLAAIIGQEMSDRIKSIKEEFRVPKE
jgi:hypothetical protein